MPSDANVEKNSSSTTLTEEQKKARVVELKKLIRGEKILKDIQTEGDYLERFLYGADFNVEEAFKKIHSLRELLIEYPEWFTKDAPIARKSLLDMDIRMVLEDCDKEGRPIYLTKMGNMDVSKMTMYDVLAVDDIWLESILSGNPQVAEKGLCVIMDMDNYSWKLMKWLRPEFVKIGVKKIEALPFNNFKVHLVNNSFFVNTVVKLVWPFLPERIKNMIIFHFNDWVALYKHIDREVLPLEYGGTKKINYSELYSKLYQRNEEILRSFESYRTVNEE